MDVNCAVQAIRFPSCLLKAHGIAMLWTLVATKTETVVPSEELERQIFTGNSNLRLGSS